MLFNRSSKETPEKKLGLFERMKRALGATKENLVSKIEAVLASRPVIDETVLDDLEGTLLGADLGVKVTDRVMGAIRLQHKRGVINTADDAKVEIRKQLLEILSSGVRADSAPSNGPVQVWMVVGVNGTGKTTTVGKLAARASVFVGSPWMFLAALDQTTKEYRFKSRPWDNPGVVDTICTRCAKGCSISACVGHRAAGAQSGGYDHGAQSGGLSRSYRLCADVQHHGCIRHVERLLPGPRYQRPYVR